MPINPEDVHDTFNSVHNLLLNIQVRKELRTFDNFEKCLDGLVALAEYYGVELEVHEVTQ